MTVKTVNFKVDDMHCRSCVMLVDMTVADVPGVSGSETDLAAGTSAVTFDDSVTSEDAIAQAICAAGHPAQPIAG